MLLEQGHSTTSPPFHLYPIVGLFACCSRSSRIILFVFVGAMRSLSISFHPFKRLEIRARQRGLFYRRGRNDYCHVPDSITAAYYSLRFSFRCVFGNHPFHFLSLISTVSITFRRGCAFRGSSEEFYNVKTMEHTRTAEGK